MNAYQGAEHFHHSRKFSHVPFPVNPLLPKKQPLGCHWCDFRYHRLLPILESPINGIIHHVLFCVCMKFFLLHVSNFFLLLSGLPLYEYTILFIHSSNDGQLDCFQFSAIMNKTPMNIRVQGLFVAIGFHFSWVNTYKWNCWVTGQTYLTF